MKKLFSLLGVAIIALVAMVAQAKTITVTINDPAGASVINITNNGITLTFTDGVASNVEISDNGQF